MEHFLEGITPFRHLYINPVEEVNDWDLSSTISNHSNYVNTSNTNSHAGEDYKIYNLYTLLMLENIFS